MLDRSIFLMTVMIMMMPMMFTMRLLFAPGNSYEIVNRKSSNREHASKPIIMVTVNHHTKQTKPDEGRRSCDHERTFLDCVYVFIAIYEFRFVLFRFLFSIVLMYDTCMGPKKSLCMFVRWYGTY